MLTYYKFSVPAVGSVVTVGTWSVSEQDARQHVSEMEGCAQDRLELVRTVQEFQESQPIAQGELL
jgi:hypothetical protein